MKNTYKILYLLFTLGGCLGFLIYSWIITYNIWVYGDFSFYEDNLIILTSETILTLSFIPGIFILIYKVVSDDTS